MAGIKKAKFTIVLLILFFVLLPKIAATTPAAMAIIQHFKEYDYTNQT